MPFAKSDYLANDDIIATVMGLGLDVEKFWFALVFIYDYVETSFKNCGLVKPASLDKAVQNLFKELGEDFTDDDIEITLKKNRKKVEVLPVIKRGILDWLRETCNGMGLSRVTCVHARAEEFAGEHRQAYDMATSRAVAALPLLSELALPLVKVGGCFLAMKSVDSDAEIDSARGAIGQLGGKIEAIRDYTIPGTDVTHRVVIIPKVKDTPPQFPRSWARMKKAPLK